MNPIAEDILMHYGVKRRSGRYPWGSGKNPYQRSADFLARVEELEAQGMTELEVAKEIGLSTTDLRMQIRVAKHERRAVEADRARTLREDGKTLQEIADILGYKNDSSVRALLNENTAANKNKAAMTAEVLKKELDEKGVLDVGPGAERVLGVSTGTLEEALFILETQGYNRFGVGVPQVTDPRKQTTTKVIAVGDIEQNHFYGPDGVQNLEEIQSIADYHSEDGGETFDKREPPVSVDAKRIAIRYGDDGGSERDGIIELRRGVEDLDLGDSHYAQVRILVDDTHYLKGMAIYSDDLPDGVDIRFNTNKPTGTDKMACLKEVKEENADSDNPFGAYIKADGQSYYLDTNGVRHLSPINKLKEEGDWSEMSKNLSSQFLSKQPLQLINKQLGLTYADSVDEFDEICSLTNPTIKKKLLLDFADECDAAAVHLKAASLPRQTTQVLIPVPSLKEGEVYAPNYNDGDKIALVRYPHAGIFEIPVLTVNNKGREGNEVIGKNVKDAIGVNAKTASQLSGADFDGDQVICIPVTDSVHIKSAPPLKGLIGFDPKTEYPYHEGMKVMKKGAMTQRQMGEISNLITDMTLKGAPEEEITRAVRHSMVVIDAAKHKLDYRQSEKDNGIPALKKKWQGYVDEEGDEKGGASTLLSRRKQEVEVPERQGSGRIDPKTGKMVYKETGRVYVDKKTGEVKKATTRVPLIEETADIRTISSGTPKEEAYANYANRMKALANKARKEYTVTPNLKYQSSAKAAYQPEVDSLMAKLRTAELNAPREREAQRIANSVVKAKKMDNPDMTKDEVKKLRNQAIYDARSVVSASGKRTRISITDKEWDAIQAGAITDTTLTSILRYADTDQLRQRATPRTSTQLSSAKVSRIKAMRSSGYTNAEIAKALNISTSTVQRAMD